MTDKVDNTGLDIMSDEAIIQDIHYTSGALWMLRELLSGRLNVENAHPRTSVEVIRYRKPLENERINLVARLVAFQKEAEKRVIL